MKNFFPLIFLLGLAALLIFAFLAGGRPQAVGPEAPPEPRACTEGQTQYCSAGNCSGVSVCIGGAWSGCRWERVCSPGSRVPCLKNNCPYALKECNECGTGYGPCLPLELPPGPGTP